MDEVRAQLREIENQLDAGAYRTGAWQPFLSQVRMLPRDQRLTLAPDLTRVSDKLHLRQGRPTLPFGIGIAAMLVVTAIGAVLLRGGLERHSNAAVIAAALIWWFAFEPLVKVGVGLLLGLRYGYAYIDGVPRFKMRLGS